MLSITHSGICSQVRLIGAEAEGMVLLGALRRRLSCGLGQS